LVKFTDFSNLFYLDIDDNGSGSGSGISSGSGSGQPPTSIIICDDEDDECESSVREITETTTKTTITRISNRNPIISTPPNAPKEKHSKKLPTTSPVPLFTIGQPRFHGDSFMVLPGLPQSSRTSLEVSMWFKAERKDGLLLLAGRRSGEKDFLAVGLVRGHLELRYHYI